MGIKDGVEKEKNSFRYLHFIFFSFLLNYLGGLKEERLSYRGPQSKWE